MQSVTPSPSYIKENIHEQTGITSTKNGCIHRRVNHLLFRVTDHSNSPSAHYTPQGPYFPGTLFANPIKLHWFNFLFRVPSHFLLVLLLLDKLEGQRRTQAGEKRGVRRVSECRSVKGKGRWAWWGRRTAGWLKDRWKEKRMMNREGRVGNERAIEGRKRGVVTWRKKIG